MKSPPCLCPARISNELSSRTSRATCLPAARCWNQSVSRPPFCRRKFLCGELLDFFVWQTKNHLGVTDGNLSIADKHLDRHGQFQQPRRIGHRRAAFANLHRDLFLRELKLFRELRITE